MASPLQSLFRPLMRLHPRRVATTCRWAVETLATIRRRRAEPRLTVGVDVNALWEPLTGVGWYVYQLLHHLALRDDVRLRLYGSTLVPTGDVPEPVVELPQGPALERVLYPIPEELCIPPGWVMRIVRRLEPLLIAIDRNDVLFAPNYFLPRRFLLARGELVATVLDLTIRVAPWTMRKETVEELQRYLESTVFSATRLVTISESVRQEMVSYGFGSADRIHAIHLGPGQLATVKASARRPDLPDRFVLFVSTIEPRKNLITLLDAWEQLAGSGDEPPLLVVCGRYGWKSGPARLRLEAAERAGRARHLGYVADSELAALYEQCLFLCLPSLYEGFGLPVVEAMLVGTPCLLSDIPALREVAGEAALYAPPTDVGAWVEAARRFSRDEALRAALVARGRERLAHFDWARTATETLEVFRKAGMRAVG